MSGCRFSLLDLLDLLILKAAKLQRLKLAKEVSRNFFYDEFFTDLDERILASGVEPRKRARLDAIAAGVSEFATPGALLDVGCGCGDTLQRLSELQGHRLHGVDYSLTTANRARRLLCDQAEIREGSALNLPYSDQSFETVTCTEVLEHLPDDCKALEEIHRILKPGGIFVLTVPYRYWFKAYQPLMGHERHYDRDTLTRLLHRCGFEVVHHLPNFPRWHRLSNYAFVICRAMGIIAARLGKNGDPHQVKAPFMRRPLLQSFNEHLAWLQRRDAKLDYASLPTSTSLVAVKITAFSPSMATE